MRQEYAFLNEKELIDDFVKSRNASSREEGGVKYFALNLVLGDYHSNKLAKLAYETGQAQALGYVCDVMIDSLPDDFEDSREKLVSLKDKLSFSFSELEILSLGLPKWAKELIQNKGQTDLNKRWHIYSPLDKAEMVDWFRVYRGDLSFMLQNAS